MDHGDPQGTHGRHDHFGEDSQEIEQSLPFLGLLIHEYISIHETNPFSVQFCRYVDHGDPKGTHGRHDHVGESHRYRAVDADSGAPNP